MVVADPSLAPAIVSLVLLKPKFNGLGSKISPEIKSVHPLSSLIVAVYKPASARMELVV